MRKILASAATAAAAAMVIGGAGLAAASTHTAASGTEHLQLMSTSATATTASTIVSGVFTAPGVDHMGNKADTVNFPGGSFQIAHSKGTGTQHFDPTTCLITITEHGTYKLLAGTGKYAGISGSGKYQLSILGVGARSGGKCSQSLPPVAFHQVINASGPVSLP
jgi:hypothetical protein